MSGLNVSDHEIHRHHDEQKRTRSEQETVGHSLAEGDYRILLFDSQATHGRYYVKALEEYNEDSDRRPRIVASSGVEVSESFDGRRSYFRREGKVPGHSLVLMFEG